MNNGLQNGIKNSCLIELVCLALIALIVTQCSCMSATLPIEPAPAVIPPQVVKNPAVSPTPAELIREVCPTIDTVNLRTGAGTGFESVAVLKAGEPLTLTGDFEKSPDGGIWWPVDTETGSGYINARYVCER